MGVHGGPSTGQRVGGGWNVVPHVNTTQINALDLYSGSPWFDTSAETPDIPTKIYRDFPQSLEENPGCSLDYPTTAFFKIFFSIKFI
jgi:hypothetical protein